MTTTTAKLVRELIKQELANTNDDLERHRLSRNDESVWSREKRDYQRRLRTALKELP